MWTYVHTGPLYAYPTHHTNTHLSTHNARYMHIRLRHYLPACQAHICGRVGRSVSLSTRRTPARLSPAHAPACRAQAYVHVPAYALMCSPARLSFYMCAHLPTSRRVHVSPVHVPVAYPCRVVQGVDGRETGVEGACICSQKIKNSTRSYLLTYNSR